jgi:hypothetical protein
MRLIRRLFSHGDFMRSAGKILKTRYEECWIARGGGRIYAHIHRPRQEGSYPGIVFVPGGISPGTDYDRAKELTADDVAAIGFVVLHYDPLGRGRTVGTEDRWGSKHQEELGYVVDHFSRLPEVDEGNLGILSFSIGITIATGALARFPLEKVRYLFDWEGPSNRFNITLNDTFEPFRDYPTSDEQYWKDREPARFIPDIACGYFRYQAETDHMQGSHKGHAIELLNLATRGKAKWTRCNDNPVNTFFDPASPDTYSWVPSALNHKGRILKYLLELQGDGNV